MATGSGKPWNPNHSPHGENGIARAFAKAHAKIAKVANLKIADSAFFVLAECDWKGVDAKAVKKTLQGATICWISRQAAQNNINAGKPAWIPTPEDEPPSDVHPPDEEPDDDTRSDDDRPPPTPPPGLNPRQQAQLRQFENAAKEHLALSAKPA
jgi:hypothetical protein